MSESKHRPSDLTQRSIQVHAQMREEIRHLRRVNAELLAALEELLDRGGQLVTRPDGTIGVAPREEALKKARAVLAKAREVAP